MAQERTIRRTAVLVDPGIQGGGEVTVELRPAPAGHGVVFKRTDFAGSVPARAENLRHSSGTTTLAAGGAEVAGVEHVLAALAWCRVTNCVVALDGPEVPMLDGSAEPYARALLAAGIEDQEGTVPEMIVRRPLRVDLGNGRLDVDPCDALVIDYQLEQAFQRGGRQRWSGCVTEQTFLQSLAPARASRIAARPGGPRGEGRVDHPDNCIVFDPPRPSSKVSPWVDERVRHEVVDLLGDLVLLEYPLRARIRARCGGRESHLALIRELLARPECWELAEPGRVAAVTVHPYDLEIESPVALAC